MLERLHNGDIDVGILALPCTMACWSRANCMRSLRAGATRFAPARGARAGSHLRSDEEHVAARGWPLPARPGACRLRSQRCSRKAGFPRTSIETLRQMVAAGVGITLLPMLASRGAYGSARGMTTVPSPNPCPAGSSARSGAKAAPAPRRSARSAIRSSGTADSREHSSTTACAGLPARSRRRCANGSHRRELAAYLDRPNTRCCNRCRGRRTQSRRRRASRAKAAEGLPAAGHSWARNWVPCVPTASRRIFSGSIPATSCTAGCRITPGR